jgi:hypothetical protein
MQADVVWVGTLERSDSEDILNVIVASNKEINPKILKKGQTVPEFEEETRGMIKDYFDTQEKENKETGRDIKNFFVVLDLHREQKSMGSWWRRR